MRGPDDLRRINRLWEKEPRKRFQSAAEILETWHEGCSHPYEPGKVYSYARGSYFRTLMAKILSGSFFGIGAVPGGYIVTN